jgi:hypothetical protein
MCRICGGRKRLPLPRGMSAGFYAFMGAGVPSQPDGSKLMLCPCATADRADASSEKMEAAPRRSTTTGAVAGNTADNTLRQDH